MAAAFVFDATWTIAAPAQAVYEVLAAPDDYPRWWPQIRWARRIDADSGELSARSRLPYSLRMTVRREVEDPGTLTLRAALTGDLVGFSRWQVRPAAGGTGPDGRPSTTATFRQEVDVTGAALRIAASLAPAVLRWNHSAMMAAGEQGLRRYLTDPASRHGGTR